KFALTQNDVSTLHQKVADVSTPGNADYGQHLSKEEVEELVAPSSDSVQAVNEWLSSHNLTSTSFSPAGDVRAVSLTVKQANALLDADYSIFTDQKTGVKTIRTLSYSIPADLKSHVLTVYPTTQFPSPRKNSQVTAFKSKRAEDAETSCSTPFTPPCAQSLYSIPSNIPAQTTSRLGVAAFSDESASYSDLKAFLAKYRPDLPSSTNFSTELFDGAVNDQSNPGLEGNLDIQWTLSLVSPTVPVTFIDIGDNGGGDFFTDIQEFLSATLNDTNPPQVMSISYAVPEAFSDQATLTSICNGFSQLAARGVSVLVASGDAGVLGGEDPSMCHRFITEFPASCPYVTGVGGTIGQGPEVAWNSSGGGFSVYFPAPSWQTASIASFMQSIPANYSTGRFNVSNRGYPDVSARMDFVEVLNGSLQTGVGTSLSTPIVASVISLLNAELIAAGKSPLGFLNPFIYANQDAFTDIVSGSNPGCNSDGFTATKGWDPITGVGTPVYTKLKAAAGL
ncbi:subtilisin-like protein, partial [Dentipellis sp. KUC8613]